MQKGFLTIPHALLNAAFRELTGGEFKLYLWLFRKIRGWHRDEGSFGRRQIAKELGIDSKTIQRNRDQLIRKGAIAYHPGSGNQPDTYRILDAFAVAAPGSAKRTTDSARQATPGDGAVDSSHLTPAAISSEQPQPKPAVIDAENDWSQEDIAWVRDSLRTATMTAVPADSAIPLQLLVRARRLGAELVVLCRWILELGESKRRIGDPIRSHQFFAKILDEDLPRYMLQNRNLVEQFERRIPT
jgi:hypothetical protein